MGQKVMTAKAVLYGQKGNKERIMRQSAIVILVVD